MKSIGKSKTVACYIEYFYKSNKIPIVCEFNEDASISVMIEFKEPESEVMISEIIKTMVNPIILNVKKVLEHSGYTLPLFESLNSNNIEYNDITYGLSLEIEENINLSKIMGCVSSIFNVQQSNLNTTGISARFKRVNNYSEMDSQEAFVIDLIEKNAPEDTILEHNHHLDRQGHSLGS